MTLAPIFTGANGGKSDDKFTGIPNSFQDSSNIDIRSNARGITLTKKLTKDSLTVITEKINCFLKVSNGDILAFGNSGGVYRKTSGVWYKNSNTISGAILSAIEFNSYVYLTNQTTLFRVSVGSISNTMSFSTFQTFTNGSIYHPMAISYDTFLLIGDGKNIASLDTSGVWDGVKLTLNPQVICKYIYILGGNVKIYSKYSSENSYTLSFWDGQLDDVKETVPLQGLDMEQFIIQNGYEYVLTKGKIGILDGYKGDTLKDISSYSNNLNSITSKEMRILFGGVGGVWEWGALNKNYPEVLSFSYTTSNSVNDEIGAIFYDGTDLYVSWGYSGTFGIDILSTSYNSTGYLITRVYFAQARSIPKISNKILTAFNKILGNDSISLYYKYDFNASWTLFATQTATSVKKNDYCDDLQFEGTWNYIEYKIVLNSGDGTTSPELYEVYLDFNMTI